jgi:hypothetical protein
MVTFLVTLAAAMSPTLAERSAYSLTSIIQQAMNVGVAVLSMRLGPRWCGPNYSAFLVLSS